MRNIWHITIPYRVIKIVRPLWLSVVVRILRIEWRKTLGRHVVWVFRGVTSSLLSSSVTIREERRGGDDHLYSGWKHTDKFVVEEVLRKRLSEPRSIHETDHEDANKDSIIHLTVKHIVECVNRELVIPKFDVSRWICVYKRLFMSVGRHRYLRFRYWFTPTSVANTLRPTLWVPMSLGWKAHPPKTSWVTPWTHTCLKPEVPQGPWFGGVYGSLLT